jgi:NAD(P)-dependent dehydrogenase (short-subunit alcohol dehydrogenase family)
VGVTLVAGGSTGIGAAVVRALRERGDTVLVADRNAGDGTSLVLEDLPGQAAFVEADFAGADWAAGLVADAVALGGGLDAVFYNAAVLEAHRLDAWTLEAWDRSMAVNLRAPFLLAQAAQPWLERSSCGRLVITASTGALRGHAGMPAYHASKSAVLGLVRALADELGPAGVTVNALCPGWIDTAFNDDFWDHQADPVRALEDLQGRIPLRRQGVPGDVVGTALFLLSPAAGYVSGQALVVDGGYTAV